MPHIELTTAEKDRALRLVEFVRGEVGDMTVNSRFVFAIEMLRLMSPEFNELKRKHASETDQSNAGSPGTVPEGDGAGGG